MEQSNRKQRLTTRQRRYAELMSLGDKSGAECARLAGYAETCAARIAVTNDRIPAVQALIQEHRKKVAERNELSEDWIIQRLMNEAENGDTGGSRVGALNILSKIKGMQLDRQEVQQVTSFADEIRAAQKERDAKAVQEPETLADQIKAAQRARNNVVALEKDAG